MNQNRPSSWTSELRAMAAPPSPQEGLGDLLLEITTDGVMDLDLGRGHAQFNARWKLMLGYEENQLAESPELMFQLSHPDDVTMVRQLLRDHLENFWPFSHTWRMRHNNGEWRWIFCRAVTNFDDGGRPRRLVGIFSDITDRIRVEERQRALVTAIPDAMIRVRMDGTIVDSKPPDHKNAEHLQPPAIGQSLWSWAEGTNFVEPLKAAMVKAIQHGEAATLEARMQVKDGAPGREAEIRVVRSGDDEAVLIIRDVTDQRKLAAQLQQAQKLEAIGQLAAGIAHEINTPMQYIGDNVMFLQEACCALLELQSMYQDTLKESANRRLDSLDLAAVTLKEEEKDLEFVRHNVSRSLEAALEGIKRVTKIVVAMKEFAHPRTDTKTLCDLNREIETTLTITENSWKYVAELETHFSPLPPVSCLPGEVNQVILNLVINAAHAIADVVGDGGSGKGRITVSTAVVDSSVEIRIRDTGGGIPEHVRPRIFEPFFTTKEVGRGSGQGLPLSRTIVVEKHGGQLDFETEVGKGTTFIVRLPIGAAPAA